MNNYKDKHKKVAKIITIIIACFLFSSNSSLAYSIEGKHVGIADTLSAELFSNIPESLALAKAIGIRSLIEKRLNKIKGTEKIHIDDIKLFLELNRNINELKDCKVDIDRGVIRLFLPNSNICILYFSSENLEIINAYEGISHSGISTLIPHQLNDNISCSIIRNIPRFSSRDVMLMSDREIMELIEPKFRLVVERHMRGVWNFARTIARKWGLEEDATLMKKLRVLCLIHDIGNIVGIPEEDKQVSAFQKLLKSHNIEFLGKDPQVLLEECNQKGVPYTKEQIPLFRVLDHGARTLRLLDSYGLKIPEDLRNLVARHMFEPTDKEFNAWFPTDHEKKLFLIFSMADTFECGNSYYRQRITDSEKYEGKFEGPEDTLDFFINKKFRGRQFIVELVDVTRKVLSSNEFGKAVQYSRTSIDDFQIERKKLKTALEGEYEAILFDVDGTLTNYHNREVPDEIIDRILFLLESNIYVGLASGRGWEVSAEAAQAGFKSMRELVEKIAQRISDKNKLKYLLCFLENGAYGVKDFSEAGMFSAEINFNIIKQDPKWQKAVYGQIQDSFTNLNILPQYRKHGLTIELIGASRTMENAKAIEKKARQILGSKQKNFDIACTKVAVDIMSKGATKDNAVHYVIQELGISEESIATVGDNSAPEGNDYSIVEREGGFCVGDYFNPEAKQISIPRTIGASGYKAVVWIIDNLRFKAKEEAVDETIREEVKLLVKLFRSIEEDTLLRIPVEVLQIYKELGIIPFLQIFQSTPNYYIELYYAYEKDKTVGSSLYEQYDFKEKPEGFSPTKQNTITLVPIMKEELDTNEIEARRQLGQLLKERLGGLDLGSTHVLPVAREGDPTSVIRGALIGTRMLFIYRQHMAVQTEQRDFIDQDFLEETVNLYNHMYGISKADTNKITEKDLVSLILSDNYSEFITVFKKLIELLPIIPVDPVQLYENATRVLRYA